MKKGKAFLRRVLPALLSVSMVFGSNAIAALAETGMEGVGLISGNGLVDTESRIVKKASIQTATKSNQLIIDDDILDEYGLDDDDLDLYLRVASGSNADGLILDEELLELLDLDLTATDSDAIPVEDSWVLMDIPYQEFYEADLNNDVEVDAFTSATYDKPKTVGLTGGSYHHDSTGADISGVKFPVYVTGDLSSLGEDFFNRVEDKDSLYENQDYSYFELSEEDVAELNFYKEASIEDGALKFSKVKMINEKEPEALDGSRLVINTDSSYGDYQLSLGEAGLERADEVYGIILSTEEGNDYGLRHLENIWLGTNVAWCTGFTDSVHGCPTSSEHYESMMGQTIKTITCYTSNGAFVIDTDIYVPVKFEGGVSVDDAFVSAGRTNVTVTGLPENYLVKYSVDPALQMSVENGVLRFTNASRGSYKLTVSDAAEKYADLTADFMLIDDQMPAVYDKENEKIVKAPDASDDAFADYLANITSVSVDGTAYAPGGRRGTLIINSDGSIKTDAAPIANEGLYNLVVTSTGYQPLSFLYQAGTCYVLMNIPYADFYAADVNNGVPVDAFTSATLNKPRTGTLAGGSYHANSDGSSIDGVTFPVKIASGSDLDLSDYTQITDDSSVTITVVNRGTPKTTTYEGSEALFESADYSFYILKDEPEYYKEIHMEDGKPVFGSVVGTKEKLTDAGAVLSTESRYGDYQLTVSGLELNLDTDKVFGVILKTNEGKDYGLRHIENIWRGTNLAWCTGFTSEVHGCNTSSRHYESIMGQTINEIVYYTSNGIFTIDTDLYVPVKFDGNVSVGDAQVSAGQTTVTVTGLPEDFDAVYSVEGLDMTVSGSVMTFANAQAGTYTLTVSDATKKYADLTAAFNLTEEQIPAEGFVLMNIPYADFYAAEINTGVDAVSSATKNKPRTGSLAGGSYHTDPEGTDISGVIYPVYVEDMSELSGYTRITDESSVSITVTNRGNTTTTEYSGRDALFEAADYSYYILSEVPEFYKVISNAADAPKFGPVQGTIQPTDATASLTLEGSHADYTIEVEGMDPYFSVADNDQVNAVVLETTDGSSYGLRHVENIWRGTELGFNTVTVSNSQGTLSTEPYKSMAGKTIDRIVYYTTKGLFEVDVNLEVPELLDAETELGAINGTYRQLFQGATFNSEYDHYWHDYCAAIVGEENADAYVAMMKYSIGGDLYGQEAVDAYSADPSSLQFNCQFIEGLSALTFNGAQISGTDASGAELFNYTYKYVGTLALQDEQGNVMMEGFKVYKAQTGHGQDAGEFTYFVMAPDTPDTTYHLEFRYGSDLDDLKLYNSGAYAYWLAAAILADADEQMYDDVIALFCLENMDYSSRNEGTNAGSLGQISDLVGTWDYYVNGTANGDLLYFTVGTDGFGHTYYNGVNSSNYQVYAYDNDGDASTKSGIYVAYNPDEGEPTKAAYTITRVGIQTILTLTGVEDGEPYTIQYVKRLKTSSHSSGGSGGGSSSSTSSSGGNWNIITLADGTVAWNFINSAGQPMYISSWQYLYNPYTQSYGWFAFDENGYMRTGWFTDTDGYVYYMHHLSDGDLGKMMTGWQFIGEKWYFFRTETAKTGEPAGSLVKDGTTPDGYHVDADGVLTES